MSLNPLNWLRKRSVGPNRRQRDITITSDRWRKELELVRPVREFLDSPTGQAWLDMLTNESPLELSLVGRVTKTERAVRLAKIEEHHRVMRLIVQSGILDHTEDKPLEATFGTETETE